MAELGFGIMRFRSEYELDTNDIQSIIDEYMCGDFCYFDLHPAYCNGMSQKIFKRCVCDVYDRSRFLVANKMPYYGINSYDDYEKIILGELQECGVKYFDYYMLHCIEQTSYLYHKKNGGFVFLKEAQEKGLAKKIGFSFHGTPELLELILQEFDYIEFVQLQVNFVDWLCEEINSKKCYEIARRYNKEILVMEPIKGGTISKQIECANIKYSISEMADLSLRFIAGLDGVKIVLSGMTEIEHVKCNRVSIKDEPVSYDYFSDILSAFNSDNLIQCTKCEYCKRECKKNVNIPAIISVLNECVKKAGEGISRLPISYHYYKTLVNSKSDASKCIQCGLCERHCPQKIRIREFMNIANEIFNNSLEIIMQKKEIYLSKIRYISEKKEFIKYDKLYSGKKVYAYGAGKIFSIFSDELKKLNIVGIIDRDKEKQGKIINGIKCVDISEVDKESFIVITVDKAEVIKDISILLKLLGYENFEVYNKILVYMSSK